jgi:hypothetical protein
MATNYKITFKNHCTPQEYVTENTRWYLDSDVGSRLSGGADAGITVTTQPVYAASVTLAASGASPVSIGATTQDFVFIKNLGLTAAGVVSASNVLISLDGTAGKYRIKLAPGESFAGEIGTASAGAEVNSVYMKTDAAAEQTVETLRGT